MRRGLRMLVDAEPEMQDHPAFAREALQAGALGFVLKEAAEAELLQAIRSAASGDTYLNPRLGARIAVQPSTPDGPPDDLSERELEVLRMIALGHTNAEIGEQLFLSVRTVETHRAHIQQKLGRTSRAELVRYALGCGLCWRSAARSSPSSTPTRSCAGSSTSRGS